MMKLSFLISVCFVAGIFGASEINAQAQTESLWKTLARITYKKEYDEFLGFKIDKPVFSDQIKALILPALPSSMFLFCGAAGTAWVMEVMAIEPIEYPAEPVVIKGKLKLNYDDVNKLMYSMTDAKIAK